MSIQDSAFADAAVALLVVGGNGRIVRGNKAAADLAGRSLDALEGELVDTAFPASAGRRALGELVADAVAGRASGGGDLTVLATVDELRLIQWTAARTPGGAVLTGADVTSAHEVTAELAHQALHDPLTGLPNRVLLREHLDHALRRLDRQGGELVVLFLDLDGFKTVNDTLGHEAGDRLLVALAERLRRALRPSDTVARLAGDEFVAVCEDIDDGPATTEIADRLLAAIERPFRIDGVDASVSASIGVAATRQGGDADELLRNADSAMYAIKQSRGRRADVVALPTRPRLVGAPALDPADGEPAAVAALPEGAELALAFQPQVSLVNGRMVAVEALARRRPPGGEPLPLAVVGPLVLRGALQEAVAWSAERVSILPVAVNLSLAELADPGLARSVAAALDEAGARPDLLRLEVPEAALVEDPATVLRALRALQDLGVGLTIDDVGRALPALEAMAPLPVDELKLDRPWVWAAPRAWAPGHGTLRAGARLAARLGLAAVAEAVESEEELAAARDAGCSAATGYWFAAPQEAEIVRQLVRADLRWPT